MATNKHNITMATIKHHITMATIKHHITMAINKHITIKYYITTEPLNIIKPWQPLNII